MSSSLKSPPKGLKNAECEKGTPPVRPPIPYVPPTDLHEKWETKKIKVELPDGTKFQMPTYGSGNNKEYLVHVIAILRLIEQKGTAAKVQEAFAALVTVRKEMCPYSNFPEDETPAKKESRKKKLAKLNESLKAKKSFAVEQAQKAYKLFRCFVAGKARTQWDRIMNEMHTKNPWIGVNGKSNKGIRVKSWISFMDCIELHKLTVFPADAAEKQHYYMQQMIKKPQQVTVRQFVSCMGVLNDYLAYLPTVFDLSMAIAGTKKINVPFNKADLAGIVLNLVPSSWVNQYNMTHSTLPKNPRALLNNLEAIKQVMNKKHNASLKAKAKEANAASAAAKGSSKKHPTSGNSGDLQVPKKARPSKFCQHCKANGGPHLTHNTKECHRYDGNRNPVSSFQGKPANAKKPTKKGGNQQMAYLMAAVESLVKKGLKKAMKTKKRNRYDSSSNSDSK
jgi:hypothetical protein